MAIQTLLDTATVKQLDDFTQQYIEMKPDEYPTATLLQLSKGKPPISEKLQWGEVESLPISSQINYGAGYADSAVDFVVDDNTGWQAGMDLMVARTKEIITIGHLDSTTGIHTCTRAARGTSAAALVDNDTLIPLSIPRIENYSYSTVSPRMTQASDIYNYIQLWAEGVAISNTQQALEAHGGKPYGEGYEDQIARAIENIKAAVNKQALWGIRSTDGAMTRTTGGLLQFASYKNYTSKDLTDRSTFETYFGEALKWGSGNLMCACSWTGLQALNRLFQGADPSNATGSIVNVAGVSIQKIQHFLGGYIYPYYEPALADDGAGTTKTGIIMTWRKGAIKERDNRPIGRYKVPPTTDGITEQIQLEAGFEFRGARNFSVLGNIVAP